MPRRDAGRPRGPFVVDAVLDATMIELAVGGPDALSIDRVARRAEVNKTTIYRRWPTRDDLVVACLERVLQQVTELPDTGSLRGDLLQLLAVTAGLLETTAGRALFRAAISDSAAPAITDLAQRRLQDGLARPTSTLVERARRRGEWSTSASPQPAIFMLVGALLHRALLERAPADQSWRETIVDLLIQGLAPASPTDPKTPHPHRRPQQG
jgi:AcrR family transcriptional regulator